MLTEYAACSIKRREDPQYTSDDAFVNISKPHQLLNGYAAWPAIPLSLVTCSII